MNCETGFLHSVGFWSVPVCLLRSRGELAIGAHLRATDLYTVGSFDPVHDAVMRIGGEAPGGRPILSVGIKCHVRIRLPATSDRQFGSSPKSQREYRAGKGMLFQGVQPAGRRMTPSKVSPVVTKRQSAMTSLRTSATIMVLRVPLRCRRCGRDTTMPARSPSETSESARRVGSCCGGPGRCRLWRAFVRAGARRSHPASLLNRRSAPLLFGHALAARAPH